MKHRMSAGPPAAAANLVAINAVDTAATDRNHRDPFRSASADGADPTTWAAPS